MSGWVCDPDGLLTSETASALDVILTKVAIGGKPFAQARCGSSGLKGFPMAVAVMHRMYVSKEAPEVVAKRFAYALLESWGVGDPACDNGVLILLSELEDQLVIAGGAAVDALLPADALAAIIAESRLDVTEQRYSAALELVATHIGLALADAVHAHDGPAPGGGGGGGGGLHWGLLLEEVVVAFGCLSATVGALYQWHRRRARAVRQYEDCRSALEGIQRCHLAALQGTAADASPALPSCCRLCLARLDAACTPSGPHLALNVRTRATDETGCSEAGSESDTEANLRQPLCPAASGGSAAAAELGQRQGVMFPCGHAFCEPCIAARLCRQLTNCPTCNRGPDEGAAAAAASAAGETAAATSATTIPVLPTSGGGGGGGGSAQLLARLRALWDDRRVRGAAGPPGSSGGEVPFLELIFRLGQLQRQYPQFLSLEMAGVWEQDLREGRDLDAQQMRSFQRRDPGARRDGLLGMWRQVRPHVSRLQGLRIWRARR